MKIELEFDRRRKANCRIGWKENSINGKKVLSMEKKFFRWKEGSVDGKKILSVERSQEESST